MRARRTTLGEVFDNPILIGTITILVVVVAVYLSYIAENGLPFVPTYDVNVQVQNADELVKNADVRVGGARVGQVLKITPEPASRAYPHPYAQLELAVQKNLQPLAPDTRYSIRLASVLGGKYLEIIPGHSRGRGIPDGGTLTIGHENPVVDLDTAFRTFGPRTQAGIRGAIGAFGDATAGRGTQFNDAIYSLGRLIGPLQTVLRTFAAPQTRLAQFISGAAATTSALAPVASTFSSLLADGATTFQALDNSQLGSAIDQTPSTEQVGTTVLTNAQPVLSEAANLVQALKPSAALLPTAAQRLDTIITRSTPVFRRVPRLASLLQTALVTVDGLARDPASSETFRVLGSSDLASFGASAFIGLGAILRAVAPAQFACNVAGIWLRNFSSALTEGDSTAAWLRFAPILAFNQMLRATAPSADLHINYYPTESSTQCQSGNEGYTGAQLIGNPPQTGTTVDQTEPPAGVLAEGEKAGLVP